MNVTTTVTVCERNLLSERWSQPMKRDSNVTSWCRCARSMVSLGLPCVCAAGWGGGGGGGGRGRGTVRVQCVLSAALSLLFVYAAGLGRQQGFVQDPVTVAPLQSNIATPPRPRRSPSTPLCTVSLPPKLFFKA